MRSQKLFTMDCGVNQRQNGETPEAFAIRLDRALTSQIEAHQQSYDNWDLLSVVPAGSNFPAGFFLSTWEYDPELHEDVKNEVSEEAVHDERPGYIKLPVNEEPVSVHYVKHGDVINVNGELFVMVSFTKDNGGATVDFMSVDDYPVPGPIRPRRQLMPNRSYASYRRLRD